MTLTISILLDNNEMSKNYLLISLNEIADKRKETTLNRNADLWLSVMGIDIYGIHTEMTS